MDKIERLDRVLDGQAVDRPPLSLWYHFGIQFGSGEQFAKLSLAYFHHYDFDFLKVMNDYFYPPPHGLETVESAEDLGLFDHFDVTGCDWGEQLRALEIISGKKVVAITVNHCRAQRRRPDIVVMGQQPAALPAVRERHPLGDSRVWFDGLRLGLFRHRLAPATRVLQTKSLRPKDERKVNRRKCRVFILYLGYIGLSFLAQRSAARTAAGPMLRYLARRMSAGSAN